MKIRVAADRPGHARPTWS